nr:DUF4265 domain-containing protein [Isoptericola sediminis]
MEAESDSWPPVLSERTWCERTDVRGELRVLNTPLFVRGIAYGDRIAARPDHELRELVYEELTGESGYSTLRIVLHEDDERAAVEEHLGTVGCVWESSCTFAQLIAVDVPPTVDYASLRGWLIRRQQAGGIGLQEGAISGIHHRQARD